VKCFRFIAAEKAEYPISQLWITAVAVVVADRRPISTA